MRPEAPVSLVARTKLTWRLAAPARVDGRAIIGDTIFVVVNDGIFSHVLAAE